MKVTAASTLLLGALVSAHSQHDRHHAHGLLHLKRGDAPLPAQDNLPCICTTYVTTITGEASCMWSYVVLMKWDWVWKLTWFDDSVSAIRHNGDILRDNVRELIDLSSYVRALIILQCPCRVGNLALRRGPYSGGDRISASWNIYHPRLNRDSNQSHHCACSGHDERIFRGVHVWWSDNGGLDVDDHYLSVC